MHFILAPTLMAVGDKQPRHVGKMITGIVTRIITHPFILATIAGIAAAWFEYQPPAAVDELLARAAAAAAPCALFAMGVTAALRPLRRVPPELTFPLLHRR